MRPDVTLLFSMVLGCGFLAEGAAQPLADVFNRVKNSVAVVLTVERNVAPSPQGGLVKLPGLGSGVLISADGKMLTAAHVVQTADQIGVEFEEGKTVPARVVASEPMADVALLQLEFVPAGAVVAPLGDSGAMRVGDEVFVIGAPYGISRSLTAGHVSARHLVAGSGGISLPLELFQTDASINMGNSGGPMFNSAGEVVGVVSYILSKSGGFEGLGFAVTSNVARDLLLKERSPWTGLEMYLLSDDLAKVFNVPQPYGVLVQRVAEGSPSARIGLRGGQVRALIGELELLVGGDIILEVGGIPVAPDAYRKTQAYFLQLKPGDPVVIKVLREGKQIELKTVKILR